MHSNWETKQNKQTNKFNEIPLTHFFFFLMKLINLKMLVVASIIFNPFKKNIDLIKCLTNKNFFSFSFFIRIRTEIKFVDCAIYWFDFQNSMRNISDKNNFSKKKCFWKFHFFFLFLSERLWHAYAAFCAACSNNSSSFSVFVFLCVKNLNNDGMFFLIFVNFQID